MNKKKSYTSSFGVPKRENHNSERFYSSKLYENLPQRPTNRCKENRVPKNILNRIFNKSSEHMNELPDCSIHLIVTSPPYNVGKEYDRDLNIEEYRKFLRRVWKESYRVLVSGGRICINVANLGRKPYIPIHSYIIEDMLEIGFLMRGEIIWHKGASAGVSTAWGSWMSAKNPTLRDVHEYILVFSKDTFKRENDNNKKDTITKEEFLGFTKSVWEFSSISAKKIGHPAPFPVELPYRCIQLYTFEEDVVLDPFMGSGTTAIAALKSKRYFVGYETEKQYVSLSMDRIKKIIKEQRNKKVKLI